MARTMTRTGFLALALLLAPLFLGGCFLFDPPTPTAPRALAMNRDTPRTKSGQFAS